MVVPTNQRALMQRNACQRGVLLMAFRPTDYYQTKGVQMTRRFIEDDDTDMIDGILQPGGHLRVPMFLKDGVTINPDLNAVQRAIAASRQRDAQPTRMKVVDA